jgi:hypothetical protein
MAAMEPRRIFALVNDTVTRYRKGIGAVLLAYGIIRLVLYFTRKR